MEIAKAAQAVQVALGVQETATHALVAGGACAVMGVRAVVDAVDAEDAPETAVMPARDAHPVALTATSLAM